MKSSSIRAIILGVLYLAFVGYVVYSAGQLPDRVASHFNWAGEPNGWESRASYLAFVVAFGLGLPSFVLGVFFVGRFVPNDLWNCPNRDYWLAPERRADTCDYLFRSSFWLAGMTLGLIAGCHYLTVEANRQGVALAHMSNPPILALAGCFVIGIAVWIVGSIRHFMK